MGGGVFRDGISPLLGSRSFLEDTRRAWVICQIMCPGKVSPAAFEERLGGGFRMTPVGRILVCNASMLFDAYLQPQ
jgi:hypothetical protein